ncbi:MAG TPA: DUF3221 domain-containing protein [Longimicrobiaceae bacterium]|nr:DUF3221 domain-containing protein [Longimicrobiaceae bacterium]
MIIVLAVAWLPGCGYLATEPASESAHTVGTITEVPSRLGTYAFLIEERPEQPMGANAGPFTTGDKYHVAVTEATRIERRTSTGGLQSASLEEITVGMRAEVWFVGPILQSYPAQATASRILILEPAP